MRLLIPMSGQGERFKKAGYSQPKPLIPINGKPMIERLLESFPAHWICCFVLAENHRSTELEKTLKKLRPTSDVVYLAPHKEGPLKAIEAALPIMPDDEGIFISYCDYGQVWDSLQFEKFVSDSNCDACLTSYKGFHAHYLNPQMYAYSRLDGEKVVEVREKGSFTDDRETEYASAGGYYFKNKKILQIAAQAQRQQNMQISGEFYTSLTVQALISNIPAAHVRIFELGSFFQWGTPQDLQRYEYWEKCYFNLNRKMTQSILEVDQILMPMAGLGSRFKTLSESPKPLIKIESAPLFAKALKTLPQANKKIVLVALESHASELEKFLPESSKTEIVKLKETPSGQALSSFAGVQNLSGLGDIIVSSCDHGLLMDRPSWVNFRKNPDCEAAIFTIRGFPGCSDSPNSFAYVKTETDTGPFARVSSVSVKKPISDRASDDALLVGTFWFSNREILATGIQELVKSDIRVNGELYLDSIFELLLKKGLKVREFPLDAYFNWGDPRSLAEALYWQEVFFRRRLDRRTQFPTLK